MKKLNYHKVNTVSSGTIRSINERIVVNLIRDRQPISRAEIARTTGLQRSTVTLLVRKLLKERVICEKGRGQSGGGRRPDLLYLNGHRACVLALDIGVTRTTLALGDFNGKTLWKEEFATIKQPEQFLKLVVSKMKAVLKTRKPGMVFEGIGVSVPGLVNVETGTVVYAPNLQWNELALGEEIGKSIGLPVYIDNDANLCALAEIWQGSISSVGSHNLVYVLVADGIGTGIAFDGQIYRGFSGGAGEFGHMRIDLNGPPCGCGNHGCWEVLASNRALVRRYQEACQTDGGWRLAAGGIEESSQSTFRIPHSAIGRSAGSRPRRLTAKQVIAKARAGDQNALTALRQTGHYLGIGIANLIVSLNPEVVVVGGEMAEAWDLIGDAIMSTTGGEVARQNRAGVRLVPSTVKESPSLSGAMVLALSARLKIPNVA
jgi:glucokinase-like ROK family protein